jgi:CBS domain containing-hemolysin-like protein
VPEVLTIALPLLAVAGLIFANAVFVAAEFSLIAADRAVVQQRADAGSGAARSVLAAMRTLSFQLSGAQLGITMTSLVVGFLAQPAIGSLLEGPLETLGAGGGAAGLSVVLALLLATSVQVVFGELVPKNWALAEPLRVALLVARPMRAFAVVAGPLIAVLNGAANRVVRGLGVEPQEELRSARSADELPYLLSESVSQGTLDADTAGLLGRTLRFGGKRAGGVMTHRTDLVTLSRDATVADLFRAARETGHSRFPVTVGGSADDVVGVAHVKDGFRVPAAERANRTVGSLARDVVAVPATLSLEDLLERLRGMGLQLAVVVDEYGGTAGLVTLEDLVEELVGEVHDEHDVEGPDEADDADGGADRWSVREVSGLLRGDEVLDALGLKLPPGPFDTLAGLVMERLGHLPEVGDVVEVEGLQLTVTALDGHRVDRIEVRRPEHDQESPESPS